jgi:hypothetical protein
MKKTSPGPLPTDIGFPFQLTGIRVHEVNVDRAPINEPAPKRLPLSVRLLTPKISSAEPSRVILLEFHTTIPDTEGRTCNIALTLEAQFLRIPTTEPLSEADVTDFETQHAVVLMWPYLRQILHNLTSSLELPVPPLPVIDPRALVSSTTTLEPKQPKARSRRKSTPKRRARER